MNEKPMSKDALKDLVIETDSGARKPRNKIMASILVGAAILWALFQLWSASPFPFMTGFLLFDDTIKRTIHLAFAIFLAFMAYPAFKSSPRRRIPVHDIIMAVVGAYCALYYFIFYEDIASRAGIVYTQDVIVACAGIALLLEATRRSLGMPLMIIASIFLLYTYFGSSPLIPDLIRHGGQSLEKITSHQWLTSEGVFGIALGVSTDFVFLFVLFGALLDKAGAGNYFIKVAFSLLGHLRGGPAKAAVLSSGMTGLISGSSIANTVTTGTFTIPLMKRVGFTGEKAGAVEVASSVNGQIMPPVMGAAAFLMVEYVSMPYIEVIKHAFLPAFISYIALLYMVHLEALKANMKGLDKPIDRTLYQSILIYSIAAVSIILLSIMIFFIINWMKGMFGDQAIYLIVGGILIAYILLARLSARLPDLEPDDPNSPIVSLPKTAPTVKTGLHYILPIAILIWFLMIERLSPGLSAFYACATMMIILFTQYAIKNFFRKQGQYKQALKKGGQQLIDGLISGSRNMIGIGVATAAAGIIVGTVSLTGVGQVLTEVVEVLSGGSLILILLFTALICIVLGMGLPTTANYIVVASLMAQVVQQLGAANGLFVPLIAIHLFVFYFGIMADVTPPVGLASFAAAAISGADPIRTGVQAFAYSIRTAVLPFFFIFNNELILIGVETIPHALFVFFYATTAILVLSAAAQGFFFARNTIVDTLLLILIAVTLFVPSFWMNMIVPEYTEAASKDVAAVIDQHQDIEQVRIYAQGEDIDGDPLKVKSYIPVVGSGEESISRYGLFEIGLDPQGRPMYEVDFDSLAFKTGIEFDFVITKVEVPQPQPNAKLLYIPAYILLVILIMMQTVRRRKQNALSKIEAETT